MPPRGGRLTKLRPGAALARRLLLAGCLTAAILPGAILPAAQAQPIRLTPPGQEPAAQDAAPQQLAPPAQTNTMPAGSQPAGNLAPPMMTAPVMPPAAQAVTPPRPAVGETSGSEAQAEQDAEGGRKAPEFVIQPLRAPDPSSAGLLDDGNGGLGSTMWQGSNRAQAMQALGVLPAPVSGPALRDLQRRLLLSVAEVPPGTAATPSILGLRVAQLYRLGRLAEAERLGSLPSRELKDPIFRELPFDLALLKNDLPKACEIAAAGLREDASPFWQKATVLCRYGAKDIPGGDLALSLWRDGPKESGAGNDPAFNTLAAALRGDARAKVETLGGASPLHFAMLRAAGRPLPKDTLDVATPALLVALVGYDKADAELRLMAAERAVQYGALPPELLAEAYTTAEIPEAQRGTLMASIAAGKDKSVRGAALLYQSTRAATDAKTRAELVKRAHDLAVARDLLLATAATYKPLLNNLVPNEASIAAAPAVIRMALAAGETGTARLWRNILLALPPERDNAGEIAAEAWPLLLIAGEDGDWRDSRYEAWLSAQADLPPAERNARAAQLLTLAEAAGIAVPPEKWDSLLTAAASNDRRGSPSVAVWRNLQRASAAKAKGETVALALAMLGNKGSLEVDGQGLASALGALRDLGLTAEAKQIALEAALLRGL